MIFVIADITITAGKRKEFLEIFNANVPEVRAEDGCIEYTPTVDVQTDIEGQAAVQQATVTVVEKWRDVECLKAHLVAPHMLKFREAAGPMIEGLNLRILEPVGD